MLGWTFTRFSFFSCLPTAWPKINQPLYLFIQPTTHHTYSKNIRLVLLYFMYLLNFLLYYFSFIFYFVLNVSTWHVYMTCCKRTTTSTSSQHNNINHTRHNQTIITAIVWPKSSQRPGNELNYDVFIRANSNVQCITNQKHVYFLLIFFNIIPSY